MPRIKIGILRETKTPPDRRVALPPAAAAEVMTRFPMVDVVVQPSDIRCFTDDEYRQAGVVLQEDLSDCDWLIGVKEVHIPELIAGKKYLFFAHVAKKQVYNRPLLQEIVKKGISLTDYEYLKDDHNCRLIAFGRWAGIIGAYNGIRAWGLKTGRYALIAPHDCHDRAEMDLHLENLDVGNLRILVTGGGRVAMGAMETLAKLGIPLISPEEYLDNPSLAPVMCRIDPWHYAEHRDGRPFVYEHFCSHPTEYRSNFHPYYTCTGLLVAAHFWDPASPRLWLPEEMKNDDFKIRVIADVSCDINGSVPSTVRATTIAEPYYDWDRYESAERPPFTESESVTVMSIDNLPGELPRDASQEFSKALIDKILLCLAGIDPCHVIDHATITRGGQLNEPFRYLESYLKGE